MQLLLLSLLTLLVVAKADRDLQIPDWSASIDTIDPQGLTFSTGAGSGNNANVVIKVYDICRTEGATRVDKGELYPASTVVGITADATNAPGNSNAVSFTFTEGIAQDTDLYTAGTGNDARVEFCAEVGLYDENTLINFAEVKLTYNINLETLIFDGHLNAYFCDPDTKEELLDDTTSTQGSLISVCFSSPEGQFEVTDILDLTVEDSTGNSVLKEPVIVDSVIQSATTPYAQKKCSYDIINDTNVCVVTLLLNADFYDFSELNLSAKGKVLLEFGGVRRNLRSLQKQQGQEATFMIKQSQFRVAKMEIDSAASSSAASMVSSMAAILAMAGTATLALL